jgi:hypothetical protein
MLGLKRGITANLGIIHAFIGLFAVVGLLAAWLPGSLRDPDLANQSFASSVYPGWYGGWIVGGSSGDSIAFLIQNWTDSGKASQLEYKPHVQLPQAAEIRFESEAPRHPVDTLLQILRQHRPMFTHLYNKHHRKHPKLQGRILFRVCGLPLGKVREVREVRIVSSTTQVAAFDENLRSGMEAWYFHSLLASDKSCFQFPLVFSE